MLIVKGVNVFPDSLHDIVSRYSSQLTGEYRVVLNHPGPYDHLDVLVESRSTLAEADRDRLKSELEKIVRQNLSVKIEIEWAPEGAFPRGEGKTSHLERRFQ